MGPNVNHLNHGTLSQNNHSHNSSENLNSTPQKNLGKHHTHNGTANTEKTSISHSIVSTKFNNGQKTPGTPIGIQKQLATDKLLGGLDSRPATPKEKEPVINLGLIQKTGESGTLSANKHKTPLSSGSAKKNNNKKARHR